MHHTMTIYLGSGGVAPRILNFATWWKWVASYTLRPHNPFWYLMWCWTTVELDVVANRKLPIPVGNLTPNIRNGVSHFTEW